MTHSAALTLALAIAAGVLVQAIAIHLSIPGIALLLVAGFLLGPEAAGVIDPSSLGSAVHTIVAFSVAVILFEGGMNLNLRRIWREQVVIRKLITLGGLVTAVCATLLARVLLSWPWRTSVLFGTLVVVTGPTVVTPLLRRVRVNRNVATILEAEAIFIDAVGALLAVVALEIAIDPTPRSLAIGAGHLLARLGAGVIGGAAGGAAIALLLRFNRLVPERLENVTALGLVLATFQLSNALMPESGIVAAIVAGTVVGHFETRAHRELRDFKEQLTVLLIGMLFTVLAASVRLQEVKSLGVPAVVVVLALMLVVRPLAVALSTRGSALGLRERAFMAWLAPRGIVAAAVASLFAETLERRGLPGGEGLRAMTFVVIATTVLLQGLPAGLAARLLRVRQPADTGMVIVGVNGLSRFVARALRSAGEQVLFIDADPEACRAAEQDGARVIYGSALDDRILQRASLDSRRGFAALTRNEAVNLLCAAKARSEHQVPQTCAAVDRRSIGVGMNSAAALDVRTAFGMPRDLRHWMGVCERRGALLERWGTAEKIKASELHWGADTNDEQSLTLFVPVVVVRRRKAGLVDERWKPRPGDELWLVVSREHLVEARRWLEKAGWRLRASLEEEPRPRRSAS